LAGRRIAARAVGGRCCAPGDTRPSRRRLARGLAHVINIFDPDVIVLGGGLSKLTHLYQVLPGLVAPHVFAEPAHIIVKPPVWGDAAACAVPRGCGNDLDVLLLLALARRVEDDLLEHALDGELAVVDEQLAADAVLEEQEAQLVDRIASLRSEPGSK
jgi:hypothetical protein